MLMLTFLFSCIQQYVGWWPICLQRIALEESSWISYVETWHAFKKKIFQVDCSLCVECRLCTSVLYIHTTCAFWAVIEILRLNKHLGGWCVREKRLGLFYVNNYHWYLAHRAGKINAFNQLWMKYSPDWGWLNVSCLICCQLVKS